MNIACEDADSNLVEVVTIADFDDEEYGGNCLVEILTLKMV